MQWQRITELALVLAAVLAPQFLLAKEIDGDEFAKATTGIALAGVVVAAYKVYRTAAKSPPPPDPGELLPQPPEEKP